MSRDRPTAAEQRVAGSLRLHLEETGQTVSAVTHEDRPDLRFSIDGHACACECVQIPPERVLNFVHARFKQLVGSGAKLVQIVWPVEPHIWVRDAIASKQIKLNAYRQNAGTERVSLLIHIPLDEKMPVLRTESPAIMQLIRSAAKNTTHQFESIFFWSPQTGVERIFPHDPPWPDMQITFDGGYPTDGFVIGTAPFSTTAEGEPPVLYDHGVIEPQLIIVPPQCREFRKYKPKYKNQRHRLKILAGSTTAEFSMETVE